MGVTVFQLSIVISFMELNVFTGFMVIESGLYHRPARVYKKSTPGKRCFLLEAFY